MTRGPISGRGRVADVLAEVVAAGTRPTWPATHVRVCRGDVGAAGVGLAVADDHAPIGVAAATPGAGQAGEDLEFTVGEGPCHLAASSGRTVHASNLAMDSRWVHYAREASAVGIAAVTSIPLQVGALQVGVLDLYWSTPGPLDHAVASNSYIHAEVATAILLLLRDNSPHLEGADALDLVDLRPVTHQAAGMVAVQLDLGLAEALLRLRAHAFTTQVSLRDAAAAVVNRGLIFDDSEAGFRTEDKDR